MRRSASGVTGAGLGLALVLFGAGDLAGQSAREGQWLSVGLGAGLDQVACNVCGGTPQAGVSGHVRFGGTLGSRVLLGAEFQGWTRGGEEARQYLGALQAILMLYGGPEARFHVRLGAGGVGYRAADDGEALTALTFGASGGIGYDYPIGESLSLTPFASLTLAPFADLKFNGELAAGDASLALLQGGFALTWH